MSINLRWVLLTILTIPSESSISLPKSSRWNLFQSNVFSSSSSLAAFMVSSSVPCALILNFFYCLRTFSCVRQSSRVQFGIYFNYEDFFNPRDRPWSLQRPKWMKRKMWDAEWWWFSPQTKSKERTLIKLVLFCLFKNIQVNKTYILF